MTKTARLLAFGAVTLVSAACAERVTSALDASSILDPAFVSLPTGFGATTSSFNSSSTAGDGGGGAPFIPGGSGEHHEHGRNGLPDGHDFMGGGLSGDFMGGPDGAGHPFDADRVPATCAFAAGVVTCTESHKGLTITRSMVITSTSGAVQSRRDSTTNSIVTHSTVVGTTSRRPNTSTVVDHLSDRTLSGLARASTQRSVDGKSAGTETTTGTDSVGAYVAVRVLGDTVSGLKVPVANGRPSYPVAGTVTRTMTATVTYTGKAAVTRSRREVLTYDGTATAKLVITRDGTTKTCTVPLPHGKPTCQ